MIARPERLPATLRPCGRMPAQNERGRRPAQNEMREPST
jgi:hypothetical protein